MIHAGQAMDHATPGHGRTPARLLHQPTGGHSPMPAVPVPHCGLHVQWCQHRDLTNCHHGLQFGHALNCLLCHIIEANPQNGPIYLSKIDLANGFYCIWLQLQDILKLGMAIPHLPSEGPLVAFPLALPMGWCNSPPIFCTATKTIADLTNQQLFCHTHYPAHPLETAAMTPPPPSPLPKHPHWPSNATSYHPAPLPCTTTLGATPKWHPLAYVDVFIDALSALHRATFAGTSKSSASSCTPSMMFLAP